MDILTFNYTKSDNKVSKRVLLPVTEPSNLYFGIDLTELSPEEQVEVSLAYEQLEKGFFDSVNALMLKHDIKNNYRNFKADRMSELEVESL